MPRKKKPQAPAPTAHGEPMSRKAILEALFDAQARAYLDILRNTPRDELKGSTLREIRTFLDQNGVTMERLEGPEAGLGPVLDAIPDYTALPMPDPYKGTAMSEGDH